MPEEANVQRYQHPHPNLIILAFCDVGNRHPQSFSNGDGPKKILDHDDRLFYEVDESQTPSAGHKAEAQRLHLKINNHHR